MDGYLTEWEEWSNCSASCDGGTRERHRTCVEPLDGGNPCVGARQQSEFCNTQTCPCKYYSSNKFVNDVFKERLSKIKE